MFALYFKTAQRVTFSTDTKYLSRGGVDFYLDLTVRLIIHPREPTHITVVAMAVIIKPNKIKGAESNEQLYWRKVKRIRL